MCRLRACISFIAEINIVVVVVVCLFIVHVPYYNTNKTLVFLRNNDGECDVYIHLLYRIKWRI